MTRLNIVASDRRLWLLILSGGVALVLGFFTLTPDQALQAVIKGGYWAMLVLTALLAWSLAVSWRGVLPGLRAEWQSGPRWPAALIAVCSLVLLVHEAYGFKILMDEAMLLGTSMSMHFDKTALVPMRGNDIQGAFQLLSGQLDKRPLFQPFLVSVLHDLTGYRPENVFVLNSVLTVLLLALAHRLGAKLAGPWAGALAVLLLTSLPLLAQNATGGGFEVLNLVMILATMLLGLRWLEQRDAARLNAFCLSGLLLANTRYESVLFLLPVALLVLLGWWQERRPVLSWLFVFTPLCLLPYALHNKMFRVRASSWELGSQPGFEKPFALSYVPDNFQHALNFFFDTSGEQSNSLLLSVLGFIAVPFFVLWLAKTLRAVRTAAPGAQMVAVFGLGFAAHTALMMVYFWGRFDDPVIRRLSLPLNLALVVAVVTVTTQLARGRTWPWRWVALAAGAGIFSHSLPAMARHDYSFTYYIGREAAWKREFMRAHPERDYLVIDNSSIFWVTHLVSATPVQQALEHKGKFVFNLRNRSFSAIYVFQRHDVDPDSGRVTVQRDDALGPDYELETVWERRFTPLTISRISRVVSVREGPTAKSSDEPTPLEKFTPAELEKIRLEYFEKFIQRLP